MIFQHSKSMGSGHHSAPGKLSFNAGLLLIQINELLFQVFNLLVLQLESLFKACLLVHHLPKVLCISYKPKQGCKRMNQMLEPSSVELMMT